VWLAFLLLIGAAVTAILGVLLWRHRRMLGASQRLALGVTSVGLACTLVGPLYWDPTYDKLWLQPMAAITAFVALALSALPATRGRRLLVLVCVGLLAVEIGLNGRWVIANAGQDTPYLREARQVGELLRPEDLLVYDWDRVSMLYSSLYGFGQPKLCLPTVATARGAAVIDDVREMVERAEGRGGRVYFLGVLDHTEESWQSFLGDRLGVPYHLLDEYRRRSRPVVTFRVEGRPVSLRVHEVTAR
jgi:hypothetical protein